MKLPITAMAMEEVKSYARVRILTSYSLCLAALLLLPAQSGTGIEVFRCTTYLSIAVIATGLHLSSKISGKNWLRPDVVFLAGFYIVHFQWLAMYLLSGLLPSSSVFLNPLEKHITYATWLSTISLLAWLLGFTAFQPRQSKLRIELALNIELVFAASVAALVLFIAFVGPAYFRGDIYKNLQTNFYQTVSGPSAYIFTLLEILVIVLLALYFYPLIIAKKSGTSVDSGTFSGTNPSKLKICMIAFYLTYLFLFLWSGERGPAIQITSVVGVILATHFRPVKLSELVGLGFIGAFFITSIGLIRSQSWNSGSQILAGEYGGWGVTSNLANSSITLYQGIELQVTEGQYYFGQLWISQILGIVPFLQSIFLSLTGWGIETVNSATKITHFMLGSNPHTGFGTSFVIDIYLNFGVPGLFFVSTLFGSLCKLVNFWILGDSGFIRFFAAVCLVSLMFYLSRSSILVPLRPIAWGIILILLLVRIRRVVHPSPV